MKEEVIRLENVVKMTDNGKRTVNGITLSISDRECVVISGPPGSGKTMLVRLIAGLEKPSTGEVFVQEEPVHEMNLDTAAVFRNKNIGILPRNPAFLDNLSVVENVALPLAILGEAAAQSRRKAAEQLKLLGLLYASHARPLQLSLLERQKIAIARALIAKPKILLLDDFAADIVETDEIAGTLHALCNYGEYTIIELTSIPKGLICQGRLILIDHGKIQEEQK